MEDCERKKLSVATSYQVGTYPPENSNMWKLNFPACDLSILTFEYGLDIMAGNSSLAG